MDSFNYLFSKTKKTLKDEGVKSLAKKTTKYVFNGMKGDKQKCKDILFINGCTLPHPSRYRVSHQREQLESNGLTTDEIFYEQLTLDKEKYYRGFVFFRCPITDTVKEFIEKAKKQDIKVGTGKFGADMMVDIVNNGPVTILLDSQKNF